MRNRLNGLLILLISAGATLFNWRLLFRDGYYYMRLALAGPLFGLGGLAMIFYPAAGVRFRSATSRQKVLILILIVAGALLGILNAYLMYTYQP